MSPSAPLPNSANTPTSSSGSSHGITFSVGFAGQAGGFVPAGPYVSSTVTVFAVSFSFKNGLQVGSFASGGTGLQVLPSFSRGVFVQMTDAGNLNSLKQGGYNFGGSGGEELVLGGDIVTGWANGGPSPSSYVGLQLFGGVGGGFPFEVHAGPSYTIGATTGGAGGTFQGGGGTFGRHGAGGTW